MKTQIESTMKVYTLEKDDPASNYVRCINELEEGHVIKFTSPLELGVVVNRLNRALTEVPDIVQFEVDTAQPGSLMFLNYGPNSLIVKRKKEKPKGRTKK